jgi:hypothetical protein
VKQRAVNVEQNESEHGAEASRGRMRMQVNAESRGSKNLFENHPGRLFSSKRPDGEARRRRLLCAPAHIPFRETESQGLGSPISLVDLRLRSNEARRPFAENPPGAGSFARGQRWLGRYSPLRGCSDLAALATAKIPRRSIPGSFQTGSET